MRREGGIEGGAAAFALPGGEGGGRGGVALGAVADLERGEGAGGGVPREDLLTALLL